MEGQCTDMELLKRAWRNEKAAPEILRFNSQLVSRVREQIQLLEETLDDFANGGVDDLVDLRLQKIEIHISRSDDLLGRLSPQERRFAKRYGSF